MKQGIFLVMVLCFAYNARTQSYFYNTQQFGLQSTLLGGAVTSGNGDLSMAYYNPAALHLAISEADVSLVKPQFNTFSFNQYFGDEIDNLDTDIDLSPSLASLKIKVNEKVNLVLITIEKSTWENTLTSKRNTEIGDVRQEQMFKYNYTGRDRWLGAGASIPINDRLSVGLSHFFSFAKFEYDYTILSSSHAISTNQQLDYFFDELLTTWSNNFTSVTKMGLHLRYPNHNIGLVVKTPNYLTLSTNGSYERNTIELDQNEYQAEHLIDFELSPSIETPWEFNFGYAYTMNRGTKFWLNLTYNTAVADYRMTTIESFDGQRLQWRAGTKAVSNYAIGVSEKLSPNFELIASFRSNRFAYENKRPNESDERLIFINEDHHHISLGTNCKFRKNTILLGIDWGFASADNANLFADFPNMNQLTTTPSTFKSNTISLLLTYGFLLDGIRGRSQK